ncbi:hypothetical membrane protein [Renibacterium salmoninarum ATCC 33209]|uniref:Hypothetical membrane protein n=1 Tax=Renibacterium salmoninarum (strain ATCC 33209 / DSM 20767 / JCM 11484 / NBRC 15589 / NCIMB 2235) TaxID=288705 RepID=A9WQ19_RENSM|nr:hypothetical protein [Renibacterium salmoninarum]ABY22445.1 hypothetical membrane protein [Renibacterium salmoninarum ATCC 33209]
MRTKIWVAAICLLLVFYLVVLVQRSILLIGDSNWIAKTLGFALILLPPVGAWAMVRELLFGSRMEKLAGILAAEGGLPVDDLPRTPGGRRVREVADAEFVKYQQEAERSPDDWRSWFRLSCAYDAAGDRKRARSSMRDAIAMFRSHAG